MSSPFSEQSPVDTVEFDALADLDESGWGALEHLGRSLHLAEGSLAATLTGIVELAVRTVPGTAYAGINLLIKGRFAPQATSGEAPQVLDGWQQREGDGPCIAASRDQAVVTLTDMGREERWPDFCAVAQSVGVCAMLCVPLWVDETHLGSLSLYSALPGSYGTHAARVARLLATHAAIAVADAQRTENLRKALVNRDVIGQAKGILMERHRITSDQAFTLLAQASQRNNRKLAEVAEEFTATGALP